MKKIAGKAIRKLDKAIPIAAITGFSDIVKEAIDTIKFCEEQETERTKILAQRDAYIRKIEAEKEVLLDYLERSFDERKENFRKFFEMADKAIASGNNEQLAMVLDGVNNLAASSPFKDLADIKSTREALSDKEKEWDF